MRCGLRYWRSSGRRLWCRRSTWPSPRRARCSCGSWPAASATPTCTRPPAPTRPATRRRCSATRARASSRRSARASRTSRSATTSSRCSRRSAASACTACRPRTNLCMAIRAEQNLGHLPDGTTRSRRDGEPIRHFMGTTTFAEYTVMPEIALAKVPEEAPLDRCALFACGLSTGLGAAMYTAKVEAGSTCVVFGAGMVGLGAVAGARLQRRRADHLRRPLRGPARAGQGPGRDRHLDRRRRHRPARARRDRRLRRRLHVRGHRDRRR